LFKSEVYKKSTINEHNYKAVNRLIGDIAQTYTKRNQGWKEVKKSLVSQVPSWMINEDGKFHPHVAK
jgi:hypothetical protein